MNVLLLVVPVLVVLGSILAMSEAAITSSNRARAMSLREQGRRNADILVGITSDPARHLNAIYLAVMFVQNGSAILVAILAEHVFGEVWVTAVSLIFTLLYFVTVEAMSKTFAILHGDRVALFLAPFVVATARVLGPAVRLLIGVSNVLLPGKGLKEGPFVSEEDIRAMAELGHEEGSIADLERRMIHSAFDFGHTEVHGLMTPRPEIVGVTRDVSIAEAASVASASGFSRLPVFDGDMDNVVGVVYVKDLLEDLSGPGRDTKLGTRLRSARFVPETKRAEELFRDMQLDKFHMALVVDEFGDLAGLVTMEDLLEEVVGDITDEHDVVEEDIRVVGPGEWRVRGTTKIRDLSEAVRASLADDDWDTVAGLIAARLSRMPATGDEIDSNGFAFRIEGMEGRRIGSVRVRRRTDPGTLR